MLQKSPSIKSEKGIKRERKRERERETETERQREGYVFQATSKFLRCQLWCI